MDQILNILFNLERVKIKNIGRILQAYKTLIGSRLQIGIEVEFDGEISLETAERFITEVISHKYYSTVIEHQMGHDGVPMHSTQHHMEGEKKREYRIRFNVRGQWQWLYLLSDMLLMFVILGMRVGSIHVHYNCIGEIESKYNGKNSYVKKRIGKPPVDKLPKLFGGKNRSPLAARAVQIFGANITNNTLYRYKAKKHTQTLEIRCITPTIYYKQLLMEILVFEQVAKELQDDHRRTKKILKIITKYYKHSTLEEEELCCSDLQRGVLLPRGGVTSKCEEVAPVPISLAGTAGRIVFQEASSSSLPEWSDWVAQEFSRMGTAVLSASRHSDIYLRDLDV